MDLLQFLLDKNNIFIVGVAVVAGVMLAFPSLRKGRSGGVSPSVATQMINQRQAVWVDVRPTEQFQAGHIAQARSVPLDDLDKKAAALPKNKPLIVVCDNGRDSARAAAKLRTLGFADTETLEGGMRAWSAANLPITQKG